MIAATSLLLAALLLGSGAQKLRHPAAAATALHRAGVPAPVAAARAVAAVEVAVGAAVLAAGGPVAWTMGLVYAGFAGFLTWRWVAGDLGEPCGCFGIDDAPLGGVHLAVDLVAIVAAALAWVSGAPGLAELAGESALVLVATAILVITGAVEVRLILTRLTTLAPLARFVP